MKLFGLLLFAAIGLMVIALYNGYPLTEGDTGAYIQQAIYPHFAADRPPFYGIFIRVTSLWTSLWFPVFAQCLLLAFLLLRYIDRITLPGVANQPIIFIGLISMISIVSFTCVSWVSAYLMPDIFAAILLVAILLFLTEPASRKTAWIYAALSLGAMTVHNSHFLITLLFAITVLIYAVIRKNRLMQRRSIALTCLSLSVWVLFCSMNAAKKYGFIFSRGKDIFMVAKLAETGILNTYLDENCGRKNLKLCNFKDQVPAGLTEFLWLDESPLYKMGGWDSCQAEYSMIVHDVWTTPRYFKMLVQKSAIATLCQLTQVQAPDKVPAQGKDLQPWKKIRQFFADEFREYNQSLQNNNLLSATACNYVYYLFFIVSVIWILFHYRLLGEELLFVYMCILWFLFLNALVVSTFSTVIYRFQYRIFWILPATNAIIMVRYYWNELNPVKQPGT